MEPPAFGRPYLLDEIKDGCSEGDSVRIAGWCVLGDGTCVPSALTRAVCGSVVSYDAAAQLCVLQDGPTSVTVDTSLLGVCVCIPGNVCCVIGEVVSAREPVVVRARVLKDRAGMDVALWRRTLALQRRFLAGDM